MSDTAKNIIIDLFLGFAIVIGVACLLDVIHAESLRDAFRLASDCFFVSGAILLGCSGLTWARNGGVWDGLGFTAKTMIDRMRPGYEKNRVTFAEYREKREEKNSSPFPMLVAGIVYLAVAFLFLALYNFSI